MIRMPISCFHCALPVPARANFDVEIDGCLQPMCCPGCAAVARAIVASGHERFYRVRTEASATGVELVPEQLRELEAYDALPVQAQFVRAETEHERSASLMLEGITCAACIWLIEKHLRKLPGVLEVRMNYATERAAIRWDETRIKLSQILQAVRQVGYRALPYDPQQQAASRHRQRRQHLRRLLVAALFGMQVMMLSISLYAGAWSGMDTEFIQLFRWLSFGLALPVLCYSGLPFFTAAWRDMRRRQVGMDLPVSLAIGIAFAASTMATWRGSGEVYFDSVVMFIFFLSASRYFETMARQRCAAQVERLVQSLPLMANRIRNEDLDVIAAASLKVGDLILVRPGEAIPADGEILFGQSSFDESLISGESRPERRGVGETVLGGSINRENPVRVQVKAIGADTVIAEIQRMMERAQSDKPPLAHLADRIAGIFIVLVLGLVAVVASYWWMQHSESWFEIALAVLIVSCPCALSLATPAALAASLGRLQTGGVLVKRSAALEGLTAITHVVFDKTGTLTQGQPLLQQEFYAEDCNPEACRDLVVSLERDSEHPLARALISALPETKPRPVDRLEYRPGGGLTGLLEGREYWVGSPDFVRAGAGIELPPDWLEHCHASTAILLADASRPLALFTFDDALRDSSQDLVRALQASGKSVVLMSGDRSLAVERVAIECGIEDYRAGMSPGDKCDAVRRLQQSGARVLMIGDGVNDAPVLAVADVSIAVGNATALAKTSADIVLLGDQLTSVIAVIGQALRTRRVIRQNLTWALMYNFGAIPAAALGLVAPWLAALGMSLSSLLVVANAMRLTR